MRSLLEEATQPLRQQSYHSSEAQAEAAVTQLQALAISESRISLLDSLAQQSATDDDKDAFLSTFSPLPVSSLIPKARVLRWQSLYLARLQLCLPFVPRPIIIVAIR